MTIVCVQNPSLLVYVYVSSLVYPGFSAVAQGIVFEKYLFFTAGKKNIEFEGRYGQKQVGLVEKHWSDSNHP